METCIYEDSEKLLSNVFGFDTIDDSIHHKEG